MKAYVHHNEADGHYFGFEGKHMGECQLVAALEVPDDIAEAGDHAALEFVFEVENFLPEGAGRRSLSVGDLVTLIKPNEQATYACESAGWSRLHGTPVQITQVGV